MQRFLKIFILLLLVGAMLCPTPLVAQSAVYDSAAEGIVSSYYHIDHEKGQLLGVAPGTTAAHLLSVCLPQDCFLSTQRPSTGALITSGDSVLTVVVTGDLDGNGEVTDNDLLVQSNVILGEELSEAATAAGDINYDGAVTITDYLQIKSTLMGLSSIEAGGPQNAEDTDSLILLSPGTRQSWRDVKGAVSFYCDTPSIAAIDKNGTVTGLKTGSAFVYARDSRGNIIARNMVSVIEQPMTVSLGTPIQVLTPDEELALTPEFDHPVSPSVTWSSSNNDIAIVNPDGVVTAKATGYTTITATAANGSAGQVYIKVTLNKEGLFFDREVYKVKPGNYRYPKLVSYTEDLDSEIIWTSSDPSIAHVNAEGAVCGVRYGDVTITATHTKTGLSASCTVSVCDVKQIAITFDDGPGGNTPWLVNYLEQENIPVTFFLIGSHIDLYPLTVVRQAMGSNEIGYHSLNHQNQLYLESEQITEDFDYANNKLKELTGREFTLWRTPGGNYDQRVLDSVELPHILWSLDTYDWNTKDADDIYMRIMNNAFDGAIVLMHDIYGTTISGATRAMTALRNAGYEFLTVSELLARDGDPAQNSVNYYYDN